MQCHTQADMNILKQCDNLKSHLYADSLIILASHDKTLSSILGIFIPDIHSGWTGFVKYFPLGFVNYLPPVTILSLFAIDLSQMLRNATDLTR